MSPRQTAHYQLGGLLYGVGALPIEELSRSDLDLLHGLMYNNDNMYTKLFSKNRAFTLVELMIVIAIIALLTGLMMANFSTSKGKSRDGQRISDLAQIQIALGLYFDRCGQFPNSIANPPSGTNNGCPSGINLGSYISKIPTPPGGSPASYDYAVNSASNPSDYLLHIYLEAANSSVTANSLATSPSTYDYASPRSWYTAATGPVSATCDNAAASRDYCVGPK